MRGGNGLRPAPALDQRLALRVPPAAHLLDRRSLGGRDYRPTVVRRAVRLRTFLARRTERGGLASLIEDLPLAGGRQPAELAVEDHLHDLAPAIDVHLDDQPFPELRMAKTLADLIAHLSQLHVGCLNSWRR